MSALHNVEIEQAILGVLLCKNDTLTSVSSILSENDFYDPVHREIYRKIVGRINKDHVASPVTLKSDFEDHEGLKQLGGPSYLVRLAGATVSAYSLKSHVEQLNELRRKRELDEALTEAQQMLRTDKDAAGVLGYIEASLMQHESVRGSGRVISFQEAILTALQQAQNAYEGGVTGALTGLKGLDDMIGGFSPGDFVLIGGRPSMGKTALALSIALGSARDGNGVVISSLEMTPDSLALRALSEATAHAGNGVAYSDAKRGLIGSQQVPHLLSAAESIKDLPIKIIPSDVREIGALYAAVKRSKRLMDDKGQKLGMVIVDYLQLLRSSKAQRFEQITEISIALKGLAMQLEVPVVALSQLSRQIEGRDNKRPVMSDLRESGQLEQDADVIMFCYRDEYYLEREKPEFTKPNGDYDEEAEADFRAALLAAKGKMEVIVAKQRMGEIGTVGMQFKPEFNLVRSGGI